MTNLLTVVAKVYFCYKYMVAFALTFFQQKISMYLPYFRTEILMLHSLTTSLSFKQVDPDLDLHIR